MKDIDVYTILTYCLCFTVLFLGVWKKTGKSLHPKDKMYSFSWLRKKIPFFFSSFLFVFLFFLLFLQKRLHNRYTKAGNKIWRRKMKVLWDEFYEGRNGGGRGMVCIMRSKAETKGEPSLFVSYCFFSASLYSARSSFSLFSLACVLFHPSSLFSCFCLNIFTEKKA